MLNKRHYLFKGKAKDCVIFAGERVMQGIFTPYFISDDDNADGKRTGGFGSNGDGIMVKPETVCEFTGFITRQGVPVYTGDIVRMGDKTAVVKKSKGSETMGNGMGGFYEFRLVNKNGLMLTKLNMPYIEVIGDIFNNSELLEACKNE